MSMGSGEVIIYTSDWPFVVEKFPDHPQSDEELQKLFDDAMALLERRQVFVQLVDTRMRSIWNPAQRRRAAGWIKEVSDQAKEFCCGAVVFTHSEIVRGALTAMLWLVPLPYPVKVVTSVEAGVRAGTLMLAERGVTPPQSEEELVASIEKKLNRPDRDQAGAG